MSAPRPDLHVRISPECRAVLAILAEVEGCPVSTLVEHIVEQDVMGRGHALKLAARQLQRMGIAGTERDQ